MLRVLNTLLQVFTELEHKLEHLIFQQRPSPAAAVPAAAVAQWSFRRCTLGRSININDSSS